MTLTIRNARPEDEDRLFFMLLDMARENSKYPVAAQKALEHIRSIIATGGAALIEDDGELVGSAGVSLQSAWFSNKQFLGDSWFYVVPSHRSSRAAVMLKGALVEFADTLGLDLVLAVFSTNDPDRKTAFIGKGMKSMGGTFMREAG